MGSKEVRPARFLARFGALDGTRALFESSMLIKNDRNLHLTLPQPPIHPGVDVNLDYRLPIFSPTLRRPLIRRRMPRRLRIVSIRNALNGTCTTLSRERYHG